MEDPRKPFVPTPLDIALVNLLRQWAPPGGAGEVEVQITYEQGQPKFVKRRLPASETVRLDGVEAEPEAAAPPSAPPRP